MGAERTSALHMHRVVARVLFQGGPTLLCAWPCMHLYVHVYLHIQTKNLSYGVFNPPSSAMAMYIQFLPIKLPQRHPRTHFLGYLCTRTRLALKALGSASYGHGGGIVQNLAFGSPYSMLCLYKHVTHFIVYLFTLRFWEVKPQKSVVFVYTPHSVMDCKLQLRRMLQTVLYGTICFDGPV